MGPDLGAVDFGVFSSGPDRLGVERCTKRGVAGLLEVALGLGRIVSFS